MASALFTLLLFIIYAIFNPWIIIKQGLQASRQRLPCVYEQVLYVPTQDSNSLLFVLFLSGWMHKWIVCFKWMKVFRPSVLLQQVNIYISEGKCAWQPDAMCSSKTAQINFPCPLVKWSHALGEAWNLMPLCVLHLIPIFASTRPLNFVLSPHPLCVGSLAYSKLHSFALTWCPA